MLCKACEDLNRDLNRELGCFRPCKECERTILRLDVLDKKRLFLYYQEKRETLFSGGYCYPPNQRLIRQLYNSSDAELQPEFEKLIDKYSNLINKNDTENKILSAKIDYIKDNL